jgi:4-hydroxy-tetrahydrodipicolinate synthase
VASNAIPAQMAQMVQAALSGDWATARAINRKFFRLMQAHFSEPSPAPVKAVLALMGRMEDNLRLPMVPVTAATQRKLEQLLIELGLLPES